MKKMIVILLLFMPAWFSWRLKGSTCLDVANTDSYGKHIDGIKEQCWPCYYYRMKKFQTREELHQFIANMPDTVDNFKFVGHEWQNDCHQDEECEIVE